MVSFPCEQPGGVRAGGGKQLPHGPGQGTAAVPRQSLWRRQLPRAVSAAAGSVALVGRLELRRGSASPDLYPGEGPLGGILTALDHSTADWNLMVACDMPALSRRVSCGSCWMPPTAARATPWCPPDHPGDWSRLCAAYHRRSPRQVSHAAFARGVRKVAAALAEVRCVTWPVPEVAYFQNVNTPEDWAAYGR